MRAESAQAAARAAPGATSLTNSSLLAALAAASAATLLLATACGSSPTSPGSAAQGTGNPFAGFVLEAPSSIAPGTTIQLRLLGASGGRTEDITDRATWESTSRDVLDVDAGGRATGRQAGRSGIRATYAGLSFNKSVLVIEPSTWWVSGQVTDGRLPIANARVEVVGGIGSGKSSTANASGSFTIYGVAGAVTFRGSAEGFSPTDVLTTVSADGAHVAIALPPAVSPWTLSGEWTLTFRAAADCPSFPAEARVRSYHATIEQSGASLRVSLSGAQFVPHPVAPGGLQNGFLGRVIGDSLTAVLAYSDWYGMWDVAEQIAANQIIAFDGTATATVTGSALVSGAFSGTIIVAYPGRNCTRQNHQFTLTR